MRRRPRGASSVRSNAYDRGAAVSEEDVELPVVIAGGVAYVQQFARLNSFLSAIGPGISAVESQVHRRQISHQDPSTQVSEHRGEPARPRADLQHTMAGPHEAGQESPVNLEADTARQVACQAVPLLLAELVVVVAHQRALVLGRGRHDCTEVAPRIEGRARYPDTCQASPRNALACWSPPERVSSPVSGAVPRRPARAAYRSSGAGCGVAHLGDCDAQVEPRSGSFSPQADR